LAKIRRHAELTAARDQVVADLRAFADRLEAATTIAELERVIWAEKDDALSGVVADLVTGLELHAEEQQR
jgi:hypothetical protein